MKKFFSMMVALAAVFTFVSCEEPAEGDDQKVALEKPVLSITNQTEDSFTVSWNSVAHADNYFVELRGVGENINATEKTFSGLTAGEYKVTVIAVAKAGSKYSDSESASITCTIAGSDDWFTQKVYLDVNEEAGANKSNAIFVDWKGVDVKTMDFGIFVAEQSEPYSDEEIKGSLQDGSDHLAEINGEGATLMVGPLSGSTAYEVIAFATGKAGQSKMIRQTITTEAAEVDDTVAAWLGSWSGKTSASFTWSVNNDGYLEGSFADEELDITLNIESYDQQPGAVIITGLSRAYPTDPNLGYIGEDGALYILAGVAIGEAYEGYTPTWVPYCYVESLDAYYFVPGEYEAMRLVNNNGTVTSEWLDVELSDGSIAVPAHLDIYADSADGVSIYNYESGFPVTLYGGDFTLTKASTASVKKASSKSFPTTTIAPVAGTIAR